MTKMTAAAAAMHCRPNHEQAGVAGLAHGAVEWRPKTRPAGMAVKLGRRRKEIAAAAGTGEHASAMLVQQQAGAGPLGAALAQHHVLFRRQQLPPFGITMGDGEGLSHGRTRAQPSRGEAQRRARQQMTTEHFYL